MNRTRNIIFNVSFFLNCLLLFLVVFYDNISVPLWVQVVGRMHPLLLHFPVVLVVLYLLWQFLPIQHKAADTTHEIAGELLLLMAAFSAALTAVMGILLSKEPGYDGDALFWHKWSGSVLSWLTLTWYAYRKKISAVKPLAVTASVVVLIMLMFAGDLGAGITHGENYLLEPVLPEAEKKQVAFDEAEVYADMIQPVLQSKCYSCHNDKKAKGELIMESAAMLLKGGKTGLLFDTARPDQGLLLKRIHLPVDDKKHMPPRGKPQLTEEEIDILQRWVFSGASFKLRVADLSPSDTLRMIAESMFNSRAEDVYDFTAAAENTIRSLNNTNRVVTPVALESPGLSVVFYNSAQYNSDALKDLVKVKEQLVELNLAHMPVTDEDVAVIAQFTNLRRLNLNFTAIKGQTIGSLKRLTNLKEFSFAGTPVTAKQMQPLLSLPGLQQVVAWNSGVTEKEAAAMHKQFSSVRIETGYRTDTILIKLNPPIIANEQQVITEPMPLQLKHYVSGTEIRYTLDGTDPDSLRSPVYSPPVMLDKNCLLKAKAYKPGWISSDIVQTNFFRSVYAPDSVQLISQPAPNYKGIGGKTIIDKEKSDLNFRNGKWLGYQGNTMESIIWFRKPVMLQNVTISSIVDIGSYIMPPVSLEVWGGKEPGKLALLSKLTPEQPVKPDLPYLKGYECNFKPAEIQYLKIVAKAVPVMPAWHPGKGDKGWFFIDELFFN